MTRDEEENAVKILATDIGVDRLIELAGRLKRDTSGSDKFKEVSAELDAAIDAELSEHTSIMTESPDAVANKKWQDQCNREADKYFELDDSTDTQAAMGHKAHK